MVDTLTGIHYLRKYGHRSIVSKKAKEKIKDSIKTIEEEKNPENLMYYQYYIKKTRNRAIENILIHSDKIILYMNRFDIKSIKGLVKTIKSKPYLMYQYLLFIKRRRVKSLEKYLYGTSWIISYYEEFKIKGRNKFYEDQLKKENHCKLYKYYMNLLE